MVAVGALTVVSGAYLISDRTGIENFLIAYRNLASGASIFVIPDHENRKVNIGICHMSGA